MSSAQAAELRSAVRVKDPDPHAQGC